MPISGIVSPFIEKLVIPKIQSFFKSAKRDYALNLVPIKEHFIEYFERTYKQFSIINTIALKNKQLKLDDIYVPLTLSHRIKDKQQYYKIKFYPKALISKYKKILVTDTAGMGKSTLMKKIFLDAVENNKAIPILIELRRLTDTNTLIQEIQNQLTPINKDFDQELLLDLFASGGFTFILDGYDEIQLIHKDKVSLNIQDFIYKAHNNTFILTSRPEHGLAGFGDFEEFRIKELELEEALTLLQKYDNEGEVSKLLIYKLDEIDYKGVREFLVNPLLVSLLYTAFEYKQAIPLKKHLFYKQVFDAYYETHDLTKGASFIHDKYSKLGIDDFEKVLRVLGYLCFQKHKIEFSKDEFSKILDECQDLCREIKFNNADFIKDLTKTVPLFTKDGLLYKWSHKSLQEYFAAQFIYRDSNKQKENILKAIYESESIASYINLLDLYYDIDYIFFRDVILLKFLSKYEDYSRTAYTKENYNRIDRKLLISRKEVTFANNYSMGTIGKEVSKRNNFVKQISNKRSVIYNMINLKNEDVFCLLVTHGYNSRENIIIQLLKTKQNNLIKKRKKIDISFFCENIAKKLTCYKLYFIEDNPKRRYNNLSNFESINNILSDSIDAINHNTALETLKEIREAHKQENQDNYLIEGI